jgi:hypothetical protein
MLSFPSDFIFRLSDLAEPGSGPQPLVEVINEKFQQGVRHPHGDREIQASRQEKGDPGGSESRYYPPTDRFEKRAFVGIQFNPI